MLATDWQRPAEEGEEQAWDVPVQGEQDRTLADAEHQAAVRKLRGLMAAMKPLDRQVLFLRDVDGCPYDEIASRLQVPLGTVTSRLARARAHLAEAFPQGGVPVLSRRASPGASPDRRLRGGPDEQP